MSPQGEKVVPDTDGPHAEQVLPDLLELIMHLERGSHKAVFCRTPAGVGGWQGAPIYLAAGEAPVEGGRIERLLVAQDTGGAIRGPVRGDLFCGTGTVAGERAGAMQQRGGYYLLLPKSVAERRQRVS